MWVEDCDNRLAKVSNFVEKWHYSHSIKGITPFRCFLVVNRNNPKISLGAAIFGKPAMIQTEQRYSEGKYRIVELRRFCLVDETPQYSESHILGILLKKLRGLGIQRILSYADPNQIRENHPDGRHTGLIYRASGFHKIQENGKTTAIHFNGRRYPIRNLDQYNNRKRKPKEWEEVPDEHKRITYHRGNLEDPIYVIREPWNLTPLSKKLLAAIESKDATLEQEDGKIVYLKDLFAGMPYYTSPRTHISS